MYPKNKAKLGEILLAQNYIQEDQLEHALIQHQQSGVSLGKVLVSLGYINEEALSAVLGRQIEISQKKRIGELLVDQGYIDNEQLETALNKQKEVDKKLGSVLVDLGYLTETKLLEVLAAHLDFQHVVLENFNLDPEVVAIMPEEMARSYVAIALYKRNRILTIAIADPTNLRSLDHIGFKTGYKIEPVIATEQEILSTIDGAYTDSGEALAKLLGDSDDELEVIEIRDEDESSVNEEGAHVVKVVNLIVTEAIRRGASDIHLEPQEHYLRLRYRIDGELLERNPIPKSVMSQVVSRLKILSGMDIAERRKPQDGRFTIRQKGREVDLRVSTFPCHLRGRGIIEKIVLRILNADASKIDLKKLGFTKSTFNEFSRLINLPNGIILVTGPTGSGKSSTLYSCIKHVSSPKVNIVTMEDPVELNIAEINQGQINNAAGFTFSAGMRAILRQDPDIIMLGEMRDQETARMAIQASLTGHMVYSTLHTNDSSEAFTRLLDMGLEPFLITACIRGVLAQRLVRKICDKCKIEIIPSDALLKNIGVRAGTPFYKGEGCSACNDSGYRGRLGIFELLVPDEKISSMVYKNASSDEIKDYAIKAGKLTTLRRDGIQKAARGLTTLEQILSAS